MKFSKFSKHLTTTCLTGKTTHSFFSLPLVRFHLQLEFVYQLLQSHHVLLVLLGLVFGDRKETISIFCNICKNLAL